MRDLLRDEEGQALFEYVLMILLVVSAAILMWKGFHKSVARAWVAFARQIAPACPGCQTDIH